MNGTGQTFNPVVMSVQYLVTMEAKKITEKHVGRWEKFAL